MTFSTVRASSSAICADVSDPAAVAEGLQELVSRWRAGTLDRGAADLSRFNRRTLAGDLADRLDRFRVAVPAGAAS